VTAVLLPAEFADLEPFAATWCLPTEPERWARRLASTMDELQAFYDAAFPRAEEAVDYQLQRKEIEAFRPTVTKWNPNLPMTAAATARQQSEGPTRID